MIARALILATVCLAGASARRSVSEYTINLDLAPEDRFIEAGLLPHFNATVWKFYNQFFANDKALTDALDLLVGIRGPEPDEMQREIESLAAASGLPAKFVQGVQMLYELQTLMVPIVNFTKKDRSVADDAAFYLPPIAGLEPLARIPWRGPGCTGIIAADNSADGNGTVNHARNLDFSPVPIMTDLVYTAKFTKGGKELFRSQMVAGYQQTITMYRPGPNGFAIERNTRYSYDKNGNVQMFKNVLGGKPLNGWQLRKICETHDNYEDAVAAIKAAPYVSTEYAIVSGVRKGTILAKAEAAVEHEQVLGKHNEEQRDDYIIITNFDFWNHDVREYFDPTAGFPKASKHTRRITAQMQLNASAAITRDVLFETINAPGVLADTIFQAVINVEHDIWNVSQPCAFKPTPGC